MSSASFTVTKKVSTDPAPQELPDDLLREDILKDREQRLIRRLSQKSMRDKQIKGRPKSAKLAQSVGSTAPSTLEMGAKKPRPKSTGTMDPLDTEAMSKEEKRKSLMEKKKKLLMLQKIKAAKLAKAGKSAEKKSEE